MLPSREQESEGEAQRSEQHFRKESENEEEENKSTVMHGTLRLMWKNEAGEKQLYWS